MTATATTKPAVLDVELAEIPDEIKQRDQWVAWRLEYRDGRWTKEPYDPFCSKHASSTNDKTWGTFQEVHAEYKLTEKWDGVGYVFAKDGPFVGVDLDDCRDPETGEIRPWTDEQRQVWPGDVPDPAEIIRQAGTYAEVSPSGTGVKLICRGKGLPSKGKSKGGKNRGDVEIYSQARFFTITGHRLDGSPGTVEDCDELIHTLLGQIEKPKRQAASSNGQAASVGANGYIPGVDEVIAIARNANNGAKFQRLFYDGDTRGFPSPSEADLALANMLAFWCGPHPELIEQAMHRSDLARDKWDREDYLPRTIEMALEGQTEFYHWNEHGDANTRADARAGDRKFYCTDTGNAERFTARHGANVRYCWPWNKRPSWDGRRWKLDDTGALEQLAKETARSILKAAAKEEKKDLREALIKFSRLSESAARRAAMLKLAQSEPGVPVLPDEFDQDPWLLNVENGTVDLRTGQLRPARQADMITKLAPVKYDPDAGCPTWDEFIDCTFRGHQELIAFVQRLLGYSVTGDTSEHILPVGWGGGANGKSTLVNAVLDVLGDDYGAKAAPNLLMAKRGESHPTELADLFGKRFVAAVESGEGRRLNSTSTCPVRNNAK